jgi:uncharacterized protein (DUF1697 family)
MSRHVALLRAVNVGNRRIAMAELTRLFADLGLKEARSVLQAGSVVFSSDGRSDQALETLLEKECADRFGFATEFMIRSRQDWARLIADNPFAAEAEAGPSHLLIYSLKAEAAPKGVAELAAWSGPERVKSAGRDLYIVYPEGIGRSKLTSARIDRAVSTPGTGRNWNTALKILALMEA